MHRKESLKGLSIGFSNIIKIYKQLNIGFNMNFDLLKTTTTYTLNYYVSGVKVLDEARQKEIPLPYTNSYNKSHQQFPNFLIKIIYEIK